MQPKYNTIPTLTILLRNVYFVEQTIPEGNYVIFMFF